VADGSDGVAMFLFKFVKNLSPTFGEEWIGRFWIFSNRTGGVYVEIPVIRMFFLKSSFGLTSGLRLAKTS